MTKRFIAAVMLAGVCSLLVGGCPPGEVLPPIGSDIANNAGMVTAPGATIVSGGNTYEGSSGASTNGLVGIVKDGRAYLYHPALGNADLNDDTSRRAVGYFIADSLFSEPAKNARAALLTSNYETSTGVRVNQPDDQSYDFTNLKKRFLAVKVTDVSPQVAFLLPRGALFETNLFELYDRYMILLGGSYSLLDTRRLTVGIAPIQTYGATVRLATLLNPDNNNVISPAVAALLVEKNRLAVNQDPELFAHVNMLDFVNLVFDGAKQLTGYLPVCVDGLTGEVALTLLQETIPKALLADQIAWERLAKGEAKDLLQSAALCGCAPQCEVLSKWLNTIGTFNWVFDDQIIGAIDSFLSDAYAEVPGLDRLHRSPIADPGPDRTVQDVDGDGIEVIQLDGTASHDPDGDQIIGFAWRWNDILVSSEAQPTLTLPIGEHTVTLRVLDSDNYTSDTVPVHLTITSQSSDVPVIVITSPVESASVTKGTTFRIQWTAQNISSPNWKFFLNKGPSLTFLQQLSPSPVNDGGGNWHADWSVPTSLSDASDYDLVVKDDNTVTDDHSGYFTITGSATASVSITAPAVSASVTKGTTYRIRWTAQNITNPIWKFFLNKGPTLTFLRQLYPTPVNEGSGSWYADWSVPTDLTSASDYDLVVKDDTSVKDDHSGYFTITGGGTASVTITAPAEGASVTKGTTYRIRWTAQNITNPTWKFFLNKGPSLTFLQQLFPSPVNEGGGSWYADWSVPTSLTSASDYDLVVKDDISVNDDHSGYFSINP